MHLKKIAIKIINKLLSTNNRKRKKKTTNSKLILSLPVYKLYEQIVY